MIYGMIYMATELEIERENEIMRILKALREGRAKRCD
jgi:hypothetical protein